ncbi:MAG: ankyrin repeat domain-containing protein [Actinomycetota bacterium]|nr:ankyrin repeat domain-containing protein [Actinomycetota bacterium]
MEKEIVMAGCGLPDNPNLEHLRKQAKDLLAQHRAGGEWATGLVREFHPEPTASMPLSGAQLVVARRYGFASWARLVEHVHIVERFTRAPHDVTDFADPVAEFLANACLTYGVDSPLRRDHARRLLAVHPDIATANIYTAAVVGDIAAARELLTPGKANEPGGPFAWEPLLYLAFSRMEGGDPVAVARLLLDAGADPNAGYLWEGLTSPFTTLTGAFGEGEDAVNQPRHRAEESLARLLLRAGADPNDSQTLYNRMFNQDDSHLRLLFEFGLGQGDGGPWHARLGPAHQTSAEMLHDVLLHAASHGQHDRVALLLHHGVEPNSSYGGHPLHQSRSAHELATRAGYSAIADLLVAAGARPSTLDEVDSLLAAAMRGDTVTTSAASSGLVHQAKAREPFAIVTAAERGNLVAVRALTGIGFDVNAMDSESALHRAAFAGDFAMVHLLLDLGANPSTKDCHHDSTPAGWADHNGHPDLADDLRSLE